MVGYLATNSAICLTAIAFPYTFTPLLSIVSKEESLGKKEELVSGAERYYKEGGEIAASRMK